MNVLWRFDAQADGCTSTCWYRAFVGRRKRLPVVCSALMLSAVGCGGDAELVGDEQSRSAGLAREASSVEPSQQQETVTDTSASNLERTRQRFVFKRRDLPLRAHGLLTSADFARHLTDARARSVIPPAHSVSLETNGAGFTPRWPEQSAAEVLLPERSNAGFRVADRTTGLALHATLLGSTEAAAQPSRGAVLYEHGGPDGGNVVHRLTPQGTEDYVSIERQPEASEITYALDVNEAVAGLRLVGNVLELVDTHGAPRLRVTAPAVVDSRGESLSTTLSVKGCDVDDSPAPPWDRAPVDPGASSCLLTVSWNGEATYPVLVDPAWTTTTTLANARADAQAVSLRNGRVLVTGGLSSDWSTCLASTELFDPATQTWATMGDMAVGRCNHALVRRADGQALVIAGYDSTYTELSSTETFDIGTGRWRTAPTLSAARAGHEAVLLSNGDVLVAGGSRVGTEKLTSRSSAWQSAASLPTSFYDHSLTPVANGKALLVGNSQVFVYTSSLNVWSPLPNAPRGDRYEHRATPLQDGRVLLTQSGSPSADLYDPTSNTWTRLGGMFTPRSSHTATLMSDGRVLIVGGYSSNYSVDVNAEVFNPIWGTFAPAPELAVGRVGHVAAALPNGSVMVAGGFDLSSYVVTGDTLQLGQKTLNAVITEYKTPPTLDASVTGSTMTELWAAVARPAQLTPGRRYPLVVFLHGNHGTCGTGTNPREDWSCEYTESGTCPTGYVVTPNHRGYDYVASELAANEYIVVSINANRGITCGGGEDGDWGFNLARGRLILRHLQQLSEWHRGVSPTPTSLGFDLRGAIDFSQVGIMGHSRGGEGARAAYEQYRDVGSPWPARVVEPVTFRGIFEIGPVDGQTSRVLNAEGTVWNVLLPMCDGDVSTLEGVKPFDRMLGLTLPTSAGPKSTYIAWGTNHNFFNSEWQVSDSGGCGNHEALFPDSPGSIPQRQIGLRSMFDFFRSNVGPSRRPEFSDLFNPELAPHFESRVDRGYSPGESVVDHLKLEEFTRASGTSYFNVRNVHSGVTVTHEVPPEHDETLKAALMVWRSSSPSTHYQINFANPGSGIDLSRYDLLDLRAGRAEDQLNVTDVAQIDVQLVNSNGTLSSAVALGEFIGGLVQPGGAGWQGGHVMLPTARIPLSLFSSAQLGRIRGIRFTPRQTPTGAVYLANVRATRSTYVGDVSPGTIVNLSPTSGPSNPVVVASRTVAAGNTVESLTTTGDGNHIEVALTTTTPFPVRDQLLTLEVGGRVQSRLSRHPSGDVRKVVFRIPKGDFDALPSGETMRVRFGRGPGTQWDFGRLNKGQVR